MDTDKVSPISTLDTVTTINNMSGTKNSCSFSTEPMLPFRHNNREETVSIQPVLTSTPADYEVDKPPAMKRICRIDTFSFDPEENDCMAGGALYNPTSAIGAVQPLIEDEGRPGENRPFLAATKSVRNVESAVPLDQEFEQLFGIIMDSSNDEDDSIENVDFRGWSSPSTRADTRSPKSSLFRSKELTAPTNSSLRVSNKSMDVVSTPPESPTHAHFPSMITPAEPPDVPKKTPDWNMDVHSMSCLNKTSPSMPSQGEEKNNRLRLMGSFPLEMKPIIRILLYMDEKLGDRGKVRKAFDIVQTCQKSHRRGAKKFRELSGSIFEALVHEMGEELGEIFQASLTYESPQLDILCSSQSESEAPSTSVSPPDLLGLAVAYGAHAMRLHPYVENFEELVRAGAEKLACMSEKEREGLWQDLVKTPLLYP
jgi:hypothetical protein